MITRMAALMMLKMCPGGTVSSGIKTCRNSVKCNCLFSAHQDKKEKIIKLGRRVPKDLNV
jgi:hypothetical protein